MKKNSINEDRLDELLVDPSFQDWVLGKASYTESNIWEETIKANPKDHPTYDEAKSIILKFKFKQQSISDSIIKQQFNNWQQNNKSPRLINKVWNVWARAAAIIIIPLCIYVLVNNQGFFLNNDSSLAMSEIVTAPGTRSMHTLSDGTKIWLNSNTRLVFPSSFNGKTRKIIIEGEAYFDVAHDKKKPFIVEAGTVDIKVLGTEFNISAYKDDDLIETTLVNGLIELSEETSGKTVKMSPKQHVRIDKTLNKLTVKNVNPELYSSWKDGKLIFENMPFKDVIRKLSRWYNVDMQLDSKELGDFSLTAIIKDETLTQTLELIKISTPINYKFFSTEQSKSGSNPNSKVVIFNVKINN